MHEYALTQNLINAALKNAKSKRIVSVHLLIGPFSEEREKSIQFYWRDLAKGTPGEGAILNFQRMPVEMKCFGCGGTFYLEDGESLCEYCQNNQFRLSGEEDVRLESVDVE